MSSRRSTLKKEITLDDEALSDTGRRKSTALTPEERRARAIRAEQRKEEKEKERQRIAKIKAEKEKVRSASGSAANSRPMSARGSATFDGTPLDGEMEGAEQALGEMGLQEGQGHPTDDDAEFEAEVKAEAEEEAKKEEDNYDVVITEGIPKPPLIQATINLDLFEMKRLIQEVPIEFRVEYVNSCDEHGCTALFFALSPDHLDHLQLLLDYGCNPNHQNNKKNGPLHIACVLNNKKACKILVDHGAFIQLENWQYQQPHSMMKQHDQISVMQALLNTLLEQFQERVATKQVFHVDAHTRSYYRSMFDIADTKNLGCLRYDEIALLLRSLEESTQVSSAPEEKWSFQWFSHVDKDKNATWNFAEFLYCVAFNINEREKLKKKAKKRALMKAKKDKKKAEETEKASARAEMARSAREARAASAAASAAASQVNSPRMSPR